MTIPYHLAPAYKFCNASTLPLIVRGSRLRFSRADTFNDAFELSPYLIPLDWTEISKLGETNMDAAKALASHAFQRVCSSLYISCFSKNYMSPESQLMWAHYGNNHKGVCFCVDFSVLQNDANLKSYYPVEVQYANSLVAERNRRNQNSPDIGMLLGATKSSVWSYEEEVRVVVESDSFDSTKFEVADGGKSIDVVFNPQCITKVIFGMKSSTSDIEEIAKSFCDIGHIPEFTRLDLEPLSLEVVERDFGLNQLILDGQRKQKAEQGEAGQPPLAALSSTSAVV